MKVINWREKKVNRWSGGTTKELFIHPVGSSFSEGDYQIRISLATVEAPQTIFTPLPGNTRTLLVLKGTQHLKHQGQHEAILKPLEQDTFSGEWTTECSGLSTNFNVMCRSNTQAQVTVVESKASAEIKYADKNTFLFLLDGRIEIDGLILSTQDAILLEAPSTMKILEQARLVAVVYGEFKDQNI